MTRLQALLLDALLLIDAALLTVIALILCGA